MPSRLPGQHLKKLRAGEKAVCVQCSKTADKGVFGLEKSEYESMFFCKDCWQSWNTPAPEPPKKSKKDKKPKALPPPTPPPWSETLIERAVEAHGPNASGGILSWAAFTTKSCCWATMNYNATLQG